MSHDLDPQFSGLLKCRKCGALFFPHETIDRINLRPCERADIVPFDGFRSVGVEPETLDAEGLAMPPRILYTLSPLNPRRETDENGARLIDKWLKERGGG